MRLAFAVSAIAIIAACSETSTGSEPAPDAGSRYVQPSTICSDGPRWPRGGTPFAHERDGPTDAPPCTPHCGPNQTASPMWPRIYLTTDALPSGTCNEEGVVCNMSAERIPSCDPGQIPVGPLHKFVCRCRGEWTCAIAVGSRTLPHCRNTDGSVIEDAGADGG